MIIKGKVHKFGDDINTDDIISAKYLVSTDAKELGSKCMESIKPEFVKAVKEGDIIVAGKNFGCGSSREHAPLAIKGCGIRAVIAPSFAAIFFRNAINIGLPILECPEAAADITEGDDIEVNLSTGEIINRTNGHCYQAHPLPDFVLKIADAGGIVNFLKTHDIQELLA